MKDIKITFKKIVKSLFNPDNKLSLIPNWLSFSRAIGGIMIPIMTYSGASILNLAAVASFLAVSDALDGPAARHIVNKSTEEGALLDAVSDKIFAFGLIIGLLPKSPIFLLNGILEGTIAVINAKSYANGNSPKSNMLGKIKIWPLSAALLLSYIGLTIGNGLFLGMNAETLMFAGEFLALATTGLEIVNIKEYLNAAKKGKEEKKNEEKVDISINEKDLNTNKKTKQKEKSLKYKLDKNVKNTMLTIGEMPEITYEEKPKQKVLKRKPSWK